MTEKDHMDRDLALRNFYTEQRDKHLQQIMAINGQGTFGTLAVVGAILIGGLSLKNENIINKGNFKSFIPWFIVFGIGIALLFSAGAAFSYFHTKQVKKFEVLIHEPIEFKSLKEVDFQIMPRRAANYLVFWGLIFLLIGVFGILINLLV